MLIKDTVALNKKTKYCKSDKNLLKIPTGRRLTSVEEFNLGPLNTNPSSGREEDLNTRPINKFSSLTTKDPMSLYCSFISLKSTSDIHQVLIFSIAISYLQWLKCAFCSPCL